MKRRFPSFCSEYAPNAFTKSGKRKISTVAKPLPFVALYLPTVSSSVWYAANTGPSGPRYVPMYSFGTTTGSVSSFHPGASCIMVHSPRLEVLQPFLRGDAFFTRLEGESWNI